MATLGKSFCSFSKGALSCTHQSQAQFSAVIETPSNMISKPSTDNKSREVLVMPRFGDGSFEFELKPVKMEQVYQGGKWVFRA
jgi:hypothetical protein